MDDREMQSDNDPEDPARKETQEFDPALVDEQGIHPEFAPDSLPKEPGDEEFAVEPDHGNR
jgi:hypothetical protein